MATQRRSEPVSAPTGTVAEITRRRLGSLARPRDVRAWVATAVVTAIAAIVRLVELGRPGRIIFDEVYYAPHGYSMLRYGVEWALAPDGAHPVDGAPVFGEGPAYVVHPPLGKWLIGLGEWVFGYDPVGWRIAAAVAGVGSVMIITRVAWRLFGSVVLAAAAGLLVALDGMHVVMSRTALLDIFLLLFVVAAFGALLRDRDQRRARWLAAVAAGAAGPPPGRPWWRFAAAVLLGCAVAVKWSAVFFVPVFIGLAIFWEVGARRSAGVPRPWRATAAGEATNTAIALLLVPVVYLASWTGWLATGHGFYRQHPVDVAGQWGLDWLVGSLRNLIFYHREALSFHTGLDASHPYESPAWQWLLLARPVAFHWSDQGSCGAAQCASTVLLLGTPLLWWSFLPAVAVLIWLGIARRDWRAPAILLGAAAGIVPWFFFDDRVTFYFYALPAQPLLVLAVVYVLGALIGPPGTDQRVLGFDRRVVGITIASGYVVLVALTFAYFYPLYTGQVIPLEAWQARMWLQTWP